MVAIDVRVIGTEVPGLLVVIEDLVLPVDEAVKVDVTLGELDEEKKMDD